MDKANVLDSSGYGARWKVAKDYPEGGLSMLVDNCAMQLVMNPGQFDVILTRTCSAISLDEASMIRISECCPAPA